MRYLTLFIFVALQSSCDSGKPTSEKEDTIQTVDSGPDSLRSYPIALTMDTMLVDTLTESQFKDSFNDEQRAYYDMHGDKSLSKYIAGMDHSWGNKKLLINGTLKEIPISGLPLSMKQYDQIKWVTTLRSGEGGRILVSLYTLDKNYDIIGFTVLTDRWGDEGYKGWSLGEFKNDSTYLTKVFFDRL